MINISSEKMLNQRTDCEDFWLTILSSLSLSSLRYSCFALSRINHTLRQSESKQLQTQKLRESPKPFLPEEHQTYWIYYGYE